MKDKKHQTSESRRTFLRDAAMGGGVAAATAALPGIAVADAAEPADNDKPRQGYRLTQHILDYYKSAAS